MQAVPCLAGEEFLQISPEVSVQNFALALEVRRFNLTGHRTLVGQQKLVVKSSSYEYNKVQ